MKTVFESLMLTMFLAAICILIYRLAKETSSSRLTDRAVSITMGIGFVIGAVCKAVVAPLEWTFTLYVFGAVLSYTAALFSFSNMETTPNDADAWGKVK